MEVGQTELPRMVEIKSQEFKRDVQLVLDSVINKPGAVLDGEASPLAVALHKSITEGILENAPQEIANLWLVDQSIKKSVD